ncbi:hypothetical protein JG687_00005585 [Phytophthora cactorum]|uniref:Uncharacterized protein n=1 Tax=Phytophthora cactorum TaxID=29920 RepID=A0A8T1UMR7_9STRA|nr:hypothetical protein JG687_00005585 [Phytophthora cactorum]
MPNRTPNLVLRIAAAKQATVRSCRATRLQRRRAEPTCRGQSAVRGVVIRELRPNKRHLSIRRRLLLHG